MDELLFAGDIKKADAQEMLSNADVAFDPKAKVDELRLLLVENELAKPLEDEVNDVEAMVSLVGLQYHKCEMNGEVFDFREGDEFEAMLWKAEKLVKFGVARFA